MESRPTILIIDSDRDFLRALQLQLNTTGHTITATSKAAAQEITLSQSFDLVVLGTLTPRGDAYAFHRWLKRVSRFDDLPIIVIDVPTDQQHIAGWSRAEGMLLDADDYLSKPIEPATLLPRITKLLDQASHRIRVMVVDDHATVRDGIRELLTLQRDILVVGEAINGQEAVDKVAQLAPDVVLMDIVMPVMNGIEATRHVGTKYQRAKVLMLSQYDDMQNVTACSEAGAWGFISKASGGARLLEGIRAVDKGERYVSA